MTTRRGKRWYTIRFLYCAKKTADASRA